MTGWPFTLTEVAVFPLVVFDDILVDKFVLLADPELLLDWELTDVVEESDEFKVKVVEALDFGGVWSSLKAAPPLATARMPMTMSEPNCQEYFIRPPINP